MSATGTTETPSKSWQAYAAFPSTSSTLRVCGRRQTRWNGEGVERSKQEMERADVIVRVVDASGPLEFAPTNGDRSGKQDRPS